VWQDEKEVVVPLNSQNSRVKKKMYQIIASFITPTGSPGYSSKMEHHLIVRILYKNFLKKSWDQNLSNTRNGLHHHLIAIHLIIIFGINQRKSV